MIILTLLALMGRVKLLWRNLLLPLDSQSVSRPRLPPIIKIQRQQKRFLLKKIWLLKAVQLLVPKNALLNRSSCLPLTFDPASPINVIYQSNCIYATNQYELKDFSRRVGTVDCATLHAWFNATTRSLKLHSLSRGQNKWYCNIIGIVI